MLIVRWCLALKAAQRLRGYKPKRVTPISLLRWSRQFPEPYRTELVRLVTKMRFFSEKETIRWLLNLNDKILGSLEKDGVSTKSVIYITTDKAGSSSGVMLNLLRTRANLERAGAKFFHYGEGQKIQRETIKLKRGAIIYVDDFAGSGNQFATSRSQVAQYIIGPFSEFLLVPCVCEEARTKCREIGVSVKSGIVHKREHRPLLDESNYLTSESRKQIIALSHQIFGARKPILGYRGLATSVIFYGNTPNTTPLIFRGNLGQKPIWGVVPRFDDM